MKLRKRVTKATACLLAAALAMSCASYGALAATPQEQAPSAVVEQQSESWATGETAAPAPEEATSAKTEPSVMMMQAAPLAEQVFDISQGDITIDGQQVTVDGQPAVTAGSIVITGSSQEHTITVLGTSTVTLRDLTLSTDSADKNLIDCRGSSCTLLLEGENTLSNAGGEKAVLHVSANTDLTVDGTGKLTIHDGMKDGIHEANGAGIGGDFEESPKSITILNGEINVQQYGTAACIGGGARADSGHIDIQGGTIVVRAEPAGGDLQCAGTGIGGGGENVKDGSYIGSAGNADISITGGIIHATALSSAFDFGTLSSGAAIGSGENKGGTIYIGGTAQVTARAENLACAIGSSNATWSSAGDTVAPPPTNPLTITIEGDAVVDAATKSLDFYGQGAYSGAAIGMSVQNLQPCSITIGGNSHVTAKGSWYGAGIGGSYVQINKQAQPLSIHIKDQATVDASAEVYGAAIGSGYGDSGAESADILIEGNPTVTAKGGWGGAGIGGAKGTSGGSIRITGGTITSTGGVGGQELFGVDIGGAGIGAGAVDDSDGYGASCGDIYIGGTARVNAYGGTGSAGIGGGNLQAVTTTGTPSVKPRDDNGGGARSITIADTASVYAVGGQGASAIGTGATYPEAAAPVVEEMTIADTATVEAYADGAKYAVDLAVTTANISNTLLNARFAEGANPADAAKEICIEIDEQVDRTLTLPANYRSFASTTSIQDEDSHKVYVKGTQDCADEYAYYPDPDNGDAKIILYPVVLGQMLTKDNLNWIEPVIITPAEIIAYMGGEEGYNGTVNADGQIETDTNSLPEPGFYFQLSDELNEALKQQDGVTEDTALDLSSHVTIQTSSGNKSWKLSLYGEAGSSSSNGKNVYRMYPGQDGQDPVRVQFTDKDGTVQVSDTFAITDALFAEYTMEIYPGAVNQSQVMAVIDGSMYPVISRASTLTIRGVTAEGSTSEASTEAPAQEVAVPSAVLDSDTEFYINDSQVKVVDGKISLLSDSIVHTGNSDQLLQDRANEVLGTEDENRYYELMYLDLVDAKNGNTWVKSSKPVTVYLPYPENTDAGYTFNLVHFEGLDRDMSVSDLESDIASCNAYSVPVETTEQGIRFTTSSFSPFALTWQESYSVTYQFQSGTQGKQLPGAVTQLLPADSRKYPVGTTVKAAALQTTRVEADGGVWTFAGWDAESKVIDGAITFVGTWRFEAGSSGQSGSSNEQKSTPAPSANPQTSVQTAASAPAIIPQTGDSFPVLFWLGILLLSGLGLAGVYFVRKKNQ